MEICGDNRFEIIAKAKADLLEGTNIETDEAEMAVIDNILFRCWQMGWLDRYDRKTESSSEKPNNCEPQTDCDEALTLLWINNMVTDEEFYRIDARLKCISCKWWNDTIVGGSECVSKECTYEPKDEPQTERSER